MDPYPKTLAQLAEQLQGVEVARVAAEDGLMFVPTSAQVISPAGLLWVQCACHALIEPREEHRAKANMSNHKIRPR